MIAALLASQRPQTDGGLGPCHLAAVRLFILMHLAIRTKLQCEILLAVKVLASQNEAGLNQSDTPPLLGKLFIIRPENRMRLIVVKTGSLGKCRP